MSSTNRVWDGSSGSIRSSSEKNEACWPRTNSLRPLQRTMARVPSACRSTSSTCHSRSRTMTRAPGANRSSTCGSVPTIGTKPLFHAEANTSEGKHDDSVLGHCYMTNLAPFPLYQTECQPRSCANTSGSRHKRDQNLLQGHALASEQKSPDPIDVNVGYGRDAAERSTPSGNRAATSSGGTNPYFVGVIELDDAEPRNESQLLRI